MYALQITVQTKRNNFCAMILLEQNWICMSLPKKVQEMYGSEIDTHCVVFTKCQSVTTIWQGFNVFVILLK